MLFLLYFTFLFPALVSAQPYTVGGDTRLDALITEALERSLEVQQSFSHYQAALQRIPQVTTLPDPILGFTQHVRTPETRVGPQTTVVSLSQRFPWFGKLSDQGKVAAKEAAALAELHEVSKAEVVRQIKLAYYDLSYIDRAITITQEDELLLRHYEQLAQARYSQGVGLQQGIVKLQAEITRDLNRLTILRRQRVDAEAVLNTLRDHPAETPIALVAFPQRPEVKVNLSRLYASGRSARPEVKAAFLDIERNEKRIHLAKRQYWPDFTLGASWGNVRNRNDEFGLLSPPENNGKDLYSLTVGVNIPLFRDKYDAGVREAAEGFSAARQAYRNTVNKVELSIRSLGFRIETIQEQIDLFERALLPQAEHALHSTEAAYSTGTVGVIDLLDGERVLLDVRVGLARLATDYMKALAEMERAIGSAFPEGTP